MQNTYVYMSISTKTYNSKKTVTYKKEMKIFDEHWNLLWWNLWMISDVGGLWSYFNFFELPV